jgi:mycothiol synthase
LSCSASTLMHELPRRAFMIIEPVRPEDLTRAFHHALARMPEPQRGPRAQLCLNLVHAGVLDARTIWVARTGAAIVGVQVCVPLSGSSCLFWLPSAETPIADQLIQTALTHFHNQGCKIAQVLANENERRLTEPLRRQGFQPTTRLLQMAHSLCGLPAPAASALRYETYSPSLANRFAATLERSYVGTLDCPELNGTRAIDEVIAGHKNQGKFHPEFWWLALEGDRPVGVAMLAEMPDAMTWELIYVGLVPEARGRGLGRALVTQMMCALQAHPAIALTLAVDARNLPALTLYQSLGFVEVERQDVLLYLW